MSYDREAIAAVILKDAFGVSWVRANRIVRDQCLASADKLIAVLPPLPEDSPEPDEEETSLIASMTDNELAAYYSRRSGSV